MAFTFILLQKEEKKVTNFREVVCQNILYQDLSLSLSFGHHFTNYIYINIYIAISQSIGLSGVTVSV